MRSASSRADVVVVGVGAAGGIAANVLADAGLRVVGLEAGGRLGRDDFRFDEIRNDIRNWMSDVKAKREVPTWRPSPDEPPGELPWPTLMANAVGGSSIHYECVSLRFLPWTFRARSHTVARYGPSALPPGTTLADWPIAYEDLESFYTAVERSIGISGRAGRVGDIRDPRGNFFEGSRSAEYPMEPLRRTGWSELSADAALRLGWHPYPAPAAINTAPYNGNGVCTYCGFCQGNGCHVNAKGSTAATVIPRAEQTGRFRIITGARVTAVDVDANGRASGVRYVKDRHEHFQPARAVLLAGYTYENTRLLLVSRSPAFPGGVANNARQVGRHAIVHVTPYAFGRFAHRRLNVFNGTIAQATCVDDWNGDNFDHAGLAFVGGGLLTTGGELKPVAVASRAMAPPGLRPWGSAWKRWLAESAQSIAVAFGQYEALSYESNYFDLDPQVRDPFGVPVVRVTHRVHENERAGCAFLGGKLREWMLEGGADDAWVTTGVPLDGRHIYGGTRMGVDPETSVVDRHGFCHESPNLGVLGASTFPTAGGHNPTLTVQATAWRTARHLVDHWSSIADE